MKKIRLKRGIFALVDDDDFELVSQYRWRAVGEGRRIYAVRAYSEGGRKMAIGMHRLLMNPPADLVVDHINGDALDNRRCNLRICTQTQNIQNQGKTARQTSSKYKGVTWVPRNRKWVANIRFSGRRKFLGYFDDEAAAAISYDLAAIRLHGEFARLNFPMLRETAFP